MSLSEMTISLTNQYEEIEHLSHLVEDFCEKNNVSENMIYPLNVVLDEVVTNIIHYAWNDKEKHSLQADLTIEDTMFTAVVEDDGQPFNPLEVEELDISTSVEERRIGGLGLHFVKTLMDCLEYRRSGEKNILILKKKLTG
ncbi:ATP-binding protein [candidate division KSB1 bacterium]|nr:ATP-binding protein [candidate division KSB1 bacterium]